jgi:selenocysteine lyase/cysteine desulfurase
MTWYEDIRSEFPIFNKMIYLDIAWTNAPPIRVTEAMREFLSRLQTEGTPAKKEPWVRMVESTRGKIAQLIGAEKNEIAFTKNTSEGICIASEGINLSKGDNVIINDLEHTPQPWFYLRRKGVDVRIAKSENGRLDPDKVFELVDPRTKAVFMSHVTFHTGYRNDLKIYSEFCHDRNIIFIVDAMQSLGGIQCNVNKLGVDILACGGHKWLLGPHGIGFIFCSRDILQEISPTYLAYPPYNLPQIAGPIAIKILQDRPSHPVLSINDDDSRKFESGQLNYAGICGLEKGIDILIENGLDRIEKRVLKLTGRLHDGLRNVGAKVLTPFPEQERGGIVMVSEPDPKALIKFLDASQVKASLRSYPGSRGNMNFAVRLSPDFYNTEEEMDKAITLIQNFLKLST